MSSHLTPRHLKEELVTFEEVKGYLPQVVTIHMSPTIEEEIRSELRTVSEELGAKIQTGYEGMEIRL